jgi:hypothetical protein
MPRAALAAAVVAAGLGSLTGTAHADACNNDTTDPKPIVIGQPSAPTLRVGLDDPLTGYTGVVVVCVGLLGNPEYTQVGGGVWYRGGLTFTPMLCDPDCHPIP